MPWQCPITPFPSNRKPLPPHHFSHLPQIEALAALQSPSSPRNRQPRHYNSHRTESGGERRRNSRSRSPPHNRFRQPPTPQASTSRAPLSPKHRCKSSSGDPPSVKSVCPVCLGRHPHRIHNCNDPKLWDGSPAFARRNAEGRLIDGSGNTLCSDWQKPNGCNLPHKSAKHECSGCGNNKHGAQKCHRAQARPGANTL
jgi:hypothetical protein